MRLLSLLTTTATLLLAITGAQATGLATCDSGPKDTWATTRWVAG